jgi:hypothetical protein
MAQTMWGVVKEGVVRPDSPLPEGTRVQIVVPDGPELEPELAAELAQWQLAGAQSLAMVERLVEEDADEEG